MASKKKQVDSEPSLYIAAEKYRWVPYTEEGQEDDPIQVNVRIRRNLLNGELESLDLDPVPNLLVDDEGNVLEGDALDAAKKRQLEAAEARDIELREAMAPFVVDWNVGYLTPSGERMKADPPAIAGGGQFGKYLPDRIVSQIYIDLRLRSTGLVKAKLSIAAVPAGGTTSDAESIPTGNQP